MGVFYTSEQSSFTAFDLCPEKRFLSQLNNEELLIVFLKIIKCLLQRSEELIVARQEVLYTMEIALPSTV